MITRATFTNPSHYCSFNSLTQCLYNIPEFRQAFINLKIQDSKNYQNLSNLSPQLIKTFDIRSKMINFLQKYQNIFQNMENPEILDLSESISTFVDTYGEFLLLHSEGDPFLEYLALLWNISVLQRPPVLNVVLTAFNIVKFFSFKHAYSNRVSNRVFLDSPPQSSICHLSFSSYYNFSLGDDEQLPQCQQHKFYTCPDILCIKYANNVIPDKEYDDFQLEIDLTDYVSQSPFDKKPIKYKINGIVFIFNKTHAIALIRNNNMWLEFNDSTQSIVDDSKRKYIINNLGTQYHPSVAFYVRT